MDQSGSRRASSRRDFLKGAAGTAAAAGVLGMAATSASAAPASALPGRRVHPPIDRVRAPHADYRRGNFESTAGGRVVVRLPAGPVTLTIRDIEPLVVSDHAKPGSAEWHNAFRVTLAGPKDTDIPQGTYPVTVNGRNFDLFVVPVIRYGDTPVYEAIIHRAYYRRANG